MHEQAIRVPVDGGKIDGDLVVPDRARGVVLFAHGSGSSRHSSRNRYVAQELNTAGLATLLIDLLTSREEQVDMRTQQLRFDIPLLARRLLHAVDWLRADETTEALRIGCFGASTGAGAALVAAAERPDDIDAVVSRGGRPDLAGDALAFVRAPTLLIVGSHDTPVIAMNRAAMTRLTAPVQLEIVPGASHLFEEPGTLERAAALARDWFADHLARSPHA